MSLTWSDACLWFAEDVIDRVDHGRQQHEGARPHQPHRDVGGGGGERGLEGVCDVAPVRGLGAEGPAGQGSRAAVEGGRPHPQHPPAQRHRDHAAQTQPAMIYTV